MKKKVFFSTILCLVLLFGVTACDNRDDKAQDERSEQEVQGEEEKQETRDEIYPDFLTKKDWKYNTLSCTEKLHFQEDGTFSYYEACGNPVGNSDCYETYSYDEDKGIVTAYGCDDSVEDLEIVVLRYTEESLLVSIDGAIKAFYTDNEVPSPIGDTLDKVEGYSAYMAIGNIKDGMIETAPANIDVDAGGLELVREEKLSETALFYSLYEQITHLEGEAPDKINTEFTELKREDVVQSEDNSFNYGYVWYNEDLEITKIVYYGLLENWE